MLMVKDFSMAPLTIEKFTLGQYCSVQALSSNSKLLLVIIETNLSSN